MENTLTIQKNGQAARPAADPTWQTTYTPCVDIFETEDGLVLQADLPGVKPEGLELRYEQGELTVHGRVAGRDEVPGLLWEYDAGEYHRVFRINEDVDVNNISATLKNGVLTLRLPKSDRAKPRKIPVEGA